MCPSVKFEAKPCWTPEVKTCTTKQEKTTKEFKFLKLVISNVSVAYYNINILKVDICPIFKILLVVCIQLCIFNGYVKIFESHFANYAVDICPVRTFVQKSLSFLAWFPALLSYICVVHREDYEGQNLRCVVGILPHSYSFILRSHLKCQIFEKL